MKSDGSRLSAGPGSKLSAGPGSRLSAGPGSRPSAGPGSRLSAPPLEHSRTATRDRLDSPVAFTHCVQELVLVLIDKPVASTSMGLLYSKED